MATTSKRPPWLGGVACLPLDFQLHFPLYRDTRDARFVAGTVGWWRELLTGKTLSVATTFSYSYSFNRAHSTGTYGTFSALAVDGTASGTFTTTFEYRLGGLYAVDSVANLSPALVLQTNATLPQTVGSWTRTEEGAPDRGGDFINPQYDVFVNIQLARSAASNALMLAIDAGVVLGFSPDDTSGSAAEGATFHVDSVTNSIRSWLDQAGTFNAQPHLTYEQAYPGGAATGSTVCGLAGELGARISGNTEPQVAGQPTVYDDPNGTDTYTAPGSQGGYTVTRTKSISLEVSW